MINKIKKLFENQAVKNIALGLSVIIYIIIIPFLINSLFKMEAPWEWLVAEWSAGDALSFYGILVSAFITMYGVYLTISFSFKQFREEQRSQILPYLSIHYYCTVHRPYDIFSSNQTSESWDDEIDSNVKFGEYL